MEQPKQQLTVQTMELREAECARSSARNPQG
jgi:hypothetical protein